MGPVQNYNDTVVIVYDLKILKIYVYKSLIFTILKLTKSKVRNAKGIILASATIFKLARKPVYEVWLENSESLMTNATGWNR